MSTQKELPPSSSRLTNQQIVRYGGAKAAEAGVATLISGAAPFVGGAAAGARRAAVEAARGQISRREALGSLYRFVRDTALGAAAGAMIGDTIAGAIAGKPNVIQGLVEPRANTSLTNIITQTNQLVDIDAGETQIPPDWKPPKEDYCGVDIKRYYALMLLDETVTMAMVDSPGRMALFHLDSSPLGQNFTQYGEERTTIAQRLKEKGCFYHDHGSLFSDYKYMRTIARHLGIQQANEIIHLNMETNEAFRICQQIIDQWFALFH